MSGLRTIAIPWRRSCRPPRRVRVEGPADDRMQPELDSPTFCVWALDLQRREVIELVLDARQRSLRLRLPLDDRPHLRANRVQHRQDRTRWKHLFM